MRSVHHNAAAVHDTGHQMMQTGRLFTGGIEHPHYGSVLAKLKGPRNETPPSVVLPRRSGRPAATCRTARAAAIWAKRSTRSCSTPIRTIKAFKVPDLLPPDYVTAVREDRRKKLRSAIDGAVASFESSADARLLDANFAGAFRLMSSREAREAFDIGAEPNAAPRSLRPHTLRPKLSAGPTVGRARRPLCDSEHV